MLKDLIEITVPVNEDLINKWNSINNIMLDKYILKTVTISGSDSYKFQHDFEGLLLSLDIPQDLVYPHIIANGLTSSTSYNGDVYDIIILDTKELYNYLELFQQ